MSAPTLFTGKVKAAILLLAPLGLYNTWIRFILNGSLSRLLAVQNGSGPTPYQLFSSPYRLLSSITGIYWPLDWNLTFMIVFFWETVDGTHPLASVVGIYFLGQYVSLIMVMWVNGYRAGNQAKGWRFSPTMWLLIFQNTVVGTSGPWFAAYYLTASPTTRILPPSKLAPLLLAPQTLILLLPISLLLTYILPSILMALPSPSLVSNTFQQLAIALWSIFPLFLSLSQYVLSATASLIQHSSPFLATGSPSPSKAPKQQYLSAARIAYAFAFTLSFASHIAILSLSLSTHLFPSLFAPKYASALHPTNIFLPSVSAAAVSSAGEGVANFLQWDQIFGYIVMLLIGGACLHQAIVSCKVRGSSQLLLLMAAVVGSLVFGPGTTVLAFTWARDELVLGVEAGAEKGSSGEKKKR